MNKTSANNFVMIKKLLLPFLLFIATAASAQLNNSWIDYSKTYYKFRIATDNICRIPQTALASAGLAATNADNFQLWRNGQQVRLFTSTNAAPLGALDYIEFFGEMNDGKADNALYITPQFQLADKHSLETDTAVYFLTVNATSANLRYVNAANPAPAIGATPDAFFMRKIDVYYKSQLNRGFGRNYGAYVHSSSYDNGEGFVSSNISAGPQVSTNYTETISGLNVYTSGPANGLSVRAKAYFNSDNSSRSLNLRVFNNAIIGSSPSLPVISTSLIDASIVANNLPLSFLQNTSSVDLNFTLSNLNPISTPAQPIENMVLANVGITYPSIFNFNNSKSFYFELSSSTTGNYLLIDNFNYGTTAPVLYDINNGRRYIGDIASTPGKVKFVLPSSTDAVRKFTLNNVEIPSLNIINNLSTKNFINYNTTATRGDYIIISNPALYNDGNGVNNVELYRAYRSSALGGGYNAKIYDIAELTDQFAFGIKSHPASIRDFARFIDAQYPIKPKAIFLIGRGVSYFDRKLLDFSPATYPANAAIADKLDFVPTFGWPPSDIMLVSQPGTSTPIIPIGRLGAITGREVGFYYQKVLQYEQNQATQSPLIADKAWMKNTMQIIGGKTQDEVDAFEYYMGEYRRITNDTLFGGTTTKYTKTSSATIQQASSDQISNDFANGLGLVKYFGHSSATTFEFNLSDPTVYNNTGKYPFFSISGCTAGNYYNFDEGRLTFPVTLSEKYILANQKGSIGFLASTHFGIPGYLHNYNMRFHEDFAKTMYGKTVGEQIKDVIINQGGNSTNLDYNVRLHLEEINLHGDPAIKINNFPKPDYVIEPQLVTITPSIITVADPSFKVKVLFRNIGKATNDSIKVYVKRLLPTNTLVTLRDTMIFAPRYTDSMNLVVPINALTDKGANKLIIELDYTNKVAELYENNNKVTVDFFIFENTLTPIFPSNYAIVNTQNIKYAASTANPLLPTSNYVMELDTTALFNSPFKKIYNKSGIGGLIEFTPTNITFIDSTVYYWRTSVTPPAGNPIWNNFSFIYLANSSEGFNQSHYYQYDKNSYRNIYLDSDRRLKFTPKISQYTLKTAHFPASQQANEYSLDNSGFIEQSGFTFPFPTNVNSIRFYIVDSITLAPWYNVSSGGVGQYGSYNPVPIGLANPGFYQFDVSTPAARQVIRNFINIIPNGNIIAMANGGAVITSLPAQWTSDPTPNLFQTLQSLGFNQLSQVTTSLPFAFIGKKGSTVAVAQEIGLSQQDKLSVTFSASGTTYSGDITSDVFGPAKKWNQLVWKGIKLESADNDKTAIQVIGINVLGNENLLATVNPATDTTLTWINAQTYPKLRLKMLNKDSITGTPNQLKYWMLKADLLPEGTVAPSILYTMKDTVDAGEPIQFSVAFKNISNVKFDSLMKISLRIRTNNNFDSIITIPKGKILFAGDTLKASYTIPSEKYIGNNTLIVEFNPNYDQQEQTLFNNILYKNFFVKNDAFNPLLDVTFDGVHILNRDIVSARPDILIKLKDESKFLALRDTGLLKVQLKFPGENNYRNYYFNNDTMRFTPANLTSGDNTATINLKPFLKKDGDYELVVSGKDVSGNTAGAIEYHTTFTVINEAKISEMLNYPNPFTTSTAFVFTLTGSQVPQNLRIQILTITGKVVKEITKEELGAIHVGRNITDYKWDGTDMYGQKLANGVYIYRVITNLNGKSLDKYKADGDDTNKYFNKGYGKMYLMR